MTVQLEIRFPWGRFHATPWGRSANEAAPEWPPSPWRLLRGLYSVWKSRAPELESTVVVSLLEKLASPPSFWLPDHREAHTRHYLPDADQRSGSDGNTDKVFDAFVALAPDESVALRWDDIDLTTAEAAALDVLASGLPYLGRSESICALTTGRTVMEGDRWLVPGGASATGETVPVLVPALPLDLPSLLATTVEVRTAGFVDPPGSRRVRYAREEESPPTPLRRVPEPPRPTVAVLGVSPAGGHGSRPNLTAALGMGELLRQAVQSQFGRELDDPQASSPTFSGKTGAERRTDQHRHAHFLSAPASGSRVIDRFVVWAPEGLGPDEVRALTRLRSLRLGARGDADGAKDLRPVDVALEALGDTEVLGTDLIGPAVIWRSLTPVVTSRHLSKAATREADGRDPWLVFLRMEVARELRWRGLDPIRIDIADPAGEAEPTPPPDRPLAPEGPPEGTSVEGSRPPAARWLEFRRHRAFKGERRTEARRPAGFVVELAEPFTGPLVLGSFAHFGLGLFVPGS